MNDGTAILLIVLFMAALVLTELLLGSDEQHRDARRRNRSGDRW
jgi:hypothetical protein